MHKMHLTKQLLDKLSSGSTLIIVCLVVSGLYGCKSSGPQSFEDSSTDAPATTTASSASSAIDTELRAIAEGFTKELKAGDFAKAVTFFSPDMQKKMSAAELEQATKSGAMAPLTSAGDFRYEPVQVSSKGNRATLRLAFDTSQQKNYRMNFVTAKVGSDWKIDTLVPPTKHRDPVTSQGKTSGAPN